MAARTRSARKGLTAYEKEQVGQIAAWKSKPVNPVAELWNVVALQAAKLTTFLIPDALVRSAIELSYRTCLSRRRRSTWSGRSYCPFCSSWRSLRISPESGWSQEPC